MGRTRPLPSLAAALLLAACASSPRPVPAPPATPPTDLPELFSGIPAAVLAGRAVFELESGVPARVARARCLLLSLESGALDAWRLRAGAAPPGSAPRRTLLAVLADRGEPAGGFTAEEEVAACIDLAVADVPGRRGTLMAALRVRGMGERALPALFHEARDGGERGRVAVGMLRMLGVPDRDLPGIHP